MSDDGERPEATKIGISPPIEVQLARVKWREIGNMVFMISLATCFCTCVLTC